MSNPIHQDWLRRLRESLRRGDMEQLQAHMELAGLETLLDPDFLILARQQDARQVVVLIATLGAANTQEPGGYERILAAYQHLQGQVRLEEAAERCARAVNGSVAFYRVLLQATQHGAPPPELAGMKSRESDLQFGIELLADAHQTASITPLLKAWQRLDRSDKPWLLCCRTLVQRAAHVRSSTEAAQLAKAVKKCLEDAPRGQDAVEQQLRIQLTHLALKCRDGALALAAAQEAFEYAPLPERRFSIAKALMMKGDLAHAVTHTDALLREMAIDPKAREVEEQAPHYSFDVAAAEDTLISVNRILRARGLRPFLMSGTLLGYAREGALLSHDKDIDFGLMGWEHQFTVAQALLEAGHFDVNLSKLTGRHCFLISAHDLRNGMAVDFFFFHDRDDYFLHGIDFDLGFTLNFQFSKFTLKEVQFLGETFAVPSNVEQNLAENYGDWKTPASSYVVTVESPALSQSNPDARRLLIHLEIMKTIAKGLNVKRVQRVLAHIDRLQLPCLSPATRSAVDAWVTECSVDSVKEAA